MISIIIANQNLTNGLGILESKISENQKNIEFDNQLMIQLRNEVDFLTVEEGMMALMNQTGLSSGNKAYDELQLRIASLYTQIISDFKILKSGAIPDNSLSDLNFEQLDNEARAAFAAFKDNTTSNNVNLHRANRLVLNEQKDNLLIRTSLIQIMGFVLSQLGTILAFLWKD